MNRKLWYLKQLEVISKPYRLRHSGKPEGRIQKSLSGDSGQARVTGFEMRSRHYFTHEQLADMIGISRPTMTEVLSNMEKDGFIKRDGKIISFDPQKFADL